MNSAIAALLLLALACANLPFLVERRLLIMPATEASKAFGWRLLELVILYFAIGLLSRQLESHFAPAQHQDWEFYAVTACIFVVMAFPGFVWRYLWPRH